MAVTNWPAAHCVTVAQLVRPVSPWYEPSLHGWQCATDVWATDVLPKRPLTHAVHADAPAALHQPGTQLLHDDCSAAPWCSPAPHCAHSVWPTPDWYVPDAHAVHCCTSLALVRASSPRLPTPHDTQNVACGAG